MIPNDNNAEIKLFILTLPIFSNIDEEIMPPLMNVTTIEVNIPKIAIYYF